MGNWDGSKPNNDGERELIDRAVKALEAELATKTCNKQIVSKLENAELARDSDETCNNKQVISKLVASEDCISRLAVNEAITRWAGSMAVLVALPTREVRPLLDSIHELPSVTPKQRTGKWQEVYAETDYRNGWIEFSCENCEYQHGLESGEYGWSYGDPIPWKYCPICGAKMVEPQERNGV